MSRQFKTLHTLPLYELNRGEAPKDGIAQPCSKFCKSKYGETCKKFYEGITTEGYFQCTYGFGVRSFLMNGKMYFFSSLLVEGVSDYKKLRSGDRLPEQSLTTAFVDGCINQLLDFQKIRAEFNDNKKRKGLLSDTIHEFRNFNAQVKANCESQTESKDNLKLNIVNNNNLAISQLITSRLNYLDFNLNPSQVTFKTINLYKKIDKVVKSIRPEALTKGVKIELTGSCNREVGLYEFIDQLPAIIIQNAVKYAHNGTSVSIEVYESQTELSFVVTNVGPAVYEDEKDKIFLKFYRGREAKGRHVGTGIGLWFAKKMVELHKGKIELTVGAPFAWGSSTVCSVSFKVTIPIR